MASGTLANGRSKLMSELESLKHQPFQSFHGRSSPRYGEELAERHLALVRKTVKEWVGEKKEERQKRSKAESK